MKNMKKNLMRLLFLLGAATLTQIPARAEIGIGEIWGTAWTIGDAIVGETTLTPAYAVKTYYWRFKETGLGAYDYSEIHKMRRDLLGQYFYYSKVQSMADPSPTIPPENTEPFPIYSLGKLNLDCKTDLGNGHFVTDATVENHTEWVWLAKVESTGLWPDDGPWTVWLKTSGYEVNCYPITPVGRYYWTPANLTKSGGQTVSLGVPNCHLDYPFYLANEFYK